MQIIMRTTEMQLGSFRNRSTFNIFELLTYEIYSFTDHSFVIPRSGTRYAVDRSFDSNSIDIETQSGITTVSIKQ